jgi:hypothetical protein
MGEAAQTSKMADQHSTNSTLRERVVEHVFVGEALRTLWRWGIVNVEVLRSEFDAHGYDLVMARRRVVRHIQFKTGTSRRPGDVSVAWALAGKPSGCLIWIRVTDGLDMGPYFWFGGAPGSPLPSLESYEIPLRATHNKEGERPPRPNHRLVPGKAFEEVKELEDVLVRLLGEFRYEVKTCVAADLSAADLDTAAALVKNGAAVRGDTKRKLQRATELAAARCRGQVVGVGAIKVKNEDRARNVAQSSQFQFPPETPELGYVAIDDHHKDNGLSFRITAQLLRDKKSAFFATTDDKYMKSTLGKAGFSRKGQEWQGERGQLSLWIRPAAG